MKLIFQIFTGDLTPKSLAAPQMIIDQLRQAHEAGRLAGVLCGWSTDANFYWQLSDVLHSWGVPLYLKIAVFSELKGYQEFDPMVDFNGFLMPPYVLNPQESFEFRCPSSARNINAPVELYDTQFSHIPFDGIFLDRIRYSSFISGIAGIGGCFCPECETQYAKAGIEIGKLCQRLRSLQTGDSQICLRAYDKGRWEIEDPILDAFFKIRKQIIERALNTLTERFHARGLQVGFDLFAPAMGYFCGQDMQRLRQIADFVKPMMYRYTTAPAGLPFEWERLRLAAGSAAAEQFENLAGDSQGNYQGLMQRELAWMRQESGCPVWPGIEANYIEPIAEIHSEQIRENIRLLTALGYDQIVASWNLARIPQSNMKALLE